MSLGDIPFVYVNDRFGDQVALPCTERNLTTESMTRVTTRGFMPIVSPKGQDSIRLGSFQSLAGAEIAGRWSGDPAAKAAGGGGGGTMELSAEIPAGKPAGGGDAPVAPTGGDDDLDALLGDLGGDDAGGGDADDDLDALLAGLSDDGDDDAAGGGDDDIDAELAALLEGL
jgi:hypothetical protein